MTPNKTRKLSIAFNQVQLNIASTVRTAEQCIHDQMAKNVKQSKTAVKYFRRHVPTDQFRNKGKRYLKKYLILIQY